jgi:hypothetical protein
MTRSEPPEKNMVIDEWDQWAKKNIAPGQTGNDLKALAFYGYLSTERARLLGFSFAGDKWPTRICSPSSKTSCHHGLTRSFPIQ